LHTVETLTGRVTRGVGASLLSQAIGLLQIIVLVPLFLKQWTSHEYGTWLTLSAFVNYLTVLDFGGQSYVANSLAVAWARGDQRSFATVLSEAVSFFFFLGAVAMVIISTALFVASALPVSGGHQPLLDRNSALILFLLTANLLLVSVPGGIYASVYRATGQFTRGSLIYTSCCFGGLLVYVAALLLHASPTWYAAAVFMTGLLTGAVFVWDSQRVIPEARAITLAPAMIIRGVRHLQGSFKFWLISVAQATTQQGSILLLSALAGPTAVVMYSVHRTLSCVPGYVAPLAQGPVLPEMSMCWSRGRSIELRSMLRTTTRTVAVVTAMIAVGIWLVAPMIFAAWTSHTVTFSPLLLAVLLAQAVAAGGWGPSVWPLLATNNHQRVAWYSALNAVCGLAAAAVLIRPFGVIGMSIGLLIADYGCNLLLFPRLGARFVGFRPGQLLREIALILLATLSAMAFGYFITVHYGPWTAVAAAVCTGLAVMYLLHKTGHLAAYVRTVSPSLSSSA
jgi:O-antigen/teichoic acid export membrane protein